LRNSSLGYERGSQLGSECFLWVRLAMHETQRTARNPFMRRSSAAAAPQALDLLEQLERQRGARQVDLEILL
jgi:hypothetical protein